MEVGFADKISGPESEKRADSFAIIMSPKWGGILVTPWVGRCAIGWRGVMMMSSCGDVRRRAPFNANSIS